MGANGGSAGNGHPSGVVNGSGIVTPDAVGLDLQVATLGSRGAAYLVDLLLFGAVLLLLFVGQAALGVSGFVPGWAGIAVLLLLAFLWQFGYPIGFETLNRGRTPGKAAMGLRVVTVEGAPVALRHATIRATVALLELTGTTGAIAVISSFSSPRSQRLGDMAAGTLVVRERRGGGTPAAETFAAPPGLESYTASLDVSGLSPSDYATIRETIRRARDLPQEVREQLTSELARSLVGSVRPAPPPTCSAEAFLVCIAAAVQARRARSELAPTRARTGPPGGAGSTPVPAPGPAPAAGRRTEQLPGSDAAADREDAGVSDSAAEAAGPPSRPGRGFAPPT
jgi:uncharacterized RDD family membrane protein YckC